MKMRWLLTLVAVAACAMGAQAQDAKGAKIDGIAHIAYRVSDLDKALAFYAKLGYEESFRFTNAEGKTTEVFVKVNDRQFIEVYPQTEPGQALGWMHVCYESDDLAGLDTLYQTRGLKVPAVKKAGAGNLLFTTTDPEGRVTEFTQYMPGSKHTLDQGKHLGEHRVAEKFLGFELPVADLAAAKQFYVAGMGFEAKDRKNGGVRFEVPGVTDMRADLETTAAGNKPETILGVADVAKAAQQLKALGLAVTAEKKHVSVADPDGNLFVFEVAKDN